MPEEASKVNLVSWQRRLLEFVRRRATPINALALFLSLVTIYESGFDLNGLAIGIFAFACVVCAGGLAKEIRELRVCRDESSNSISDAYLGYWLAITWRAGVALTLAFSIPLLLVYNHHETAIKSLGILPKCLTTQMSSANRFYRLILFQYAILLFLTYRVGAFSFGRNRERPILSLSVSVLPAILLICVQLSPALFIQSTTVSFLSNQFSALPIDAISVVPPKLNELYLEDGFRKNSSSAWLILSLNLASWLFYIFSLRRNLSLGKRVAFVTLLLLSLCGTGFASYQIRYVSLDPSIGFGFEAEPFSRLAIHKWILIGLTTVSLAYAQNYRASLNTDEPIANRKRNFFGIAGKVILGLVLCGFMNELFLTPTLFNFSTMPSNPIWNLLDTANRELSDLSDELPALYFLSDFCQLMTACVKNVWSLPILYDPIATGRTFLIFCWIFQQFRSTRKIRKVEAGHVSLLGFIYSSIALLALLFASVETMIWSLFFGLVCLK